MASSKPASNISLSGLNLSGASLSGKSALKFTSLVPGKNDQVLKTAHFNFDKAILKNIQSVIITDIKGSGKLFLNGQELLLNSSGQTSPIPKSLLDKGKLVFRPDPNDFGEYKSGCLSFSYRASAALDGSNSTNLAKFSIDLQAAPLMAKNSSANIDEKIFNLEGGRKLYASDFKFFNPSDPKGNLNSSKIKITKLSPGATLMQNQNGKWVDVPSKNLAKLIISMSDIDSGKYMIKAGSAASGALINFTVSANGKVFSKSVGTLALKLGDTPAAVEGNTTGSVKEDAQSSVSGVIKFKDTDPYDKPVFEDNKVFSGNYGKITVNADGVWTYELDNTKSTVNRLTEGQTAQDFITVTSSNGKASQVIAINISGSNDAPIIVSKADFAAINEDTLGTPEYTGNKVSELFTMSDLDAVSQQGIALKAVDNADGRWQYSTDNGANWKEVGSVSDTSALLLNGTDYLRFIPNANYNGSSSVSYYAWDGSAGRSENIVDVSSWGGATAFSKQFSQSML